MKRIGKSDRVKETVQKRAYIPGVVPGPVRREGLGGLPPVELVRQSAAVYSDWGRCYQVV